MIIDSPIGRIDVSQIKTFNCECGGKYEYTGDILTSYPGVALLKCDACKKRREHYCSFPKWYSDLGQSERRQAEKAGKLYDVMTEDNPLIT